MIWRNSDSWLALVDGGRFILNNHPCTTSVVNCGTLLMPTGQLVACDPFVEMQRSENYTIAIPSGRYPVRVTLADVSEAGDGSHLRVAYASLILRDERETERRILTPQVEGVEPLVLEPGAFMGIPVDTGTVCLVDGGALATGMPDEDNWPGLFDNPSGDSWFDQMGDPTHVREEIANIVLPLAQHGESIILIRSGWGNGFYPLVGGYNAQGNLVAVHIDFFVVPDPEDKEEERATGREE